MVGENIIKEFLEGIGPYSKLEHVRAVEANNYKNKAEIFIRKPQQDEVLQKTVKFTPFIFVKEIDFTKFFKHKYVLIDPDFITNESFIYEDVKYTIVDKKELSDGECSFIKEDEWTANNIYKLYIGNIADRKKYYKEKLKQYNIKVKKLKIDETNDRLFEGFKYLYEIHELEYPNMADNPLLMYNRSGKIKRLNCSYTNLQNFFKEGDMNVYARKGLFLNKKNIIEYVKNCSKVEQIKLYYSTLDILKKANLDLADIFQVNIKEADLVKWVKDNYSFEISSTYSTYNSFYVKGETVDVKNISDGLTVVNESYEDAFITKGKHHHLYLTPNDSPELELYTNVSPFLEGLIQISPDWNIAGKVVEKYLEYFVQFYDDSKSVIVLDKKYEELFGDNFYNFINLLETHFNKRTPSIKRTQSFSYAQMANYVDIIGLDKFASEVAQTELINISINEEKLDEVNFSFHKGYKGKKFLNILEYNKVGLFKEVKPYFQPLNIVTQCMIQTGIRLFKGMTFDDLKILTIDIETKPRPEYINRDRAALYPEFGEIFQIGISCTDGYSKILYADNEVEEKKAIIETYEILRDKNPDFVLTFNGESFDWPYLEKRLEMLGGVSADHEGNEDSLNFIRKIIGGEEENYNRPFYMKTPATLKVGGATEKYNQTSVLGMSFLDGMHCVKKLQAIDKRDSLGLKQNVKLEKIQKPDRVYVPGNKIGEIGKDTRDYYLNIKDGTYFVGEKTIISQKKVFSVDDIKRNSKGLKYYGSPNNLYILSDNGIDEKIDGCFNVINYKGQSIVMFRNSIYDNVRKFDNLVLPYKRFGLEYKDEPKFKELIDFMIKMKEDFKDLSVVYKNTLDFDDYMQVSGSTIVERYLLDDLWETLQLFKKTGQSSFMLSSWIPIGIQKIYTMGYASMWKILLSGWHYHNNLGVPDYEPYRKINGGLIGMFKAGFIMRVVKYDASSLYPSAKLAYLPPPSWDLMGVTDGLLRFFLETRLTYKKLTKDFWAQGDFDKSKMYDILQGPLKIFINSYYGFLGAYDVSPFSDMFTAHGITANSRSFAVHLIYWFEMKGFEAIYVHTDGVNFQYPSNVDDYVYMGLGTNWLVERGHRYTGLKAYVAEYNDTFMEDKMGVDIDGVDVSCVNIAKSNVIHYKFDSKKGNSIDIVGGLIKKDTSNYIKNFILENLEILMKGDGREFLINYFFYIKKIVDRKLLGIDIASKVKFKGLQTYENTYKVKVAAYELIKAKKLKIDEGDVFYFYNTGKGISTPDFTTIKTDLGYFDITNFSDSQINEIYEILDTNNRPLIKQYILENDFTFNKSRQRYVNNEVEEYTIDVSKGEGLKEIVEIIKERKYDASYSLSSAQPKGDYDSGPIKELIEPFTGTNKEILKALKKMIKEDINLGEDVYTFTVINDTDTNALLPNTYMLDNFDEWDKINYKRKTKTSKRDGKQTIIQLEVCKEELNVNYLPLDDQESLVDYNTAKYLESFIKAVSPLFLAFNEDVRELLHVDVDTENYSLPLLSKSDFELVSGIPLKGKESNQQKKEEVTVFDPIEMKYWFETKKSPYYFLDKLEFTEDRYEIKKNNNLYCVLNNKGRIQMEGFKKKIYK